MIFLKATQTEVASTSTDDGTQSIRWYVDAAFAVHKDFRNHTAGATLTLEEGVVCSVSAKQEKVNSTSSTEAELVGVDDVISKVLWTSLMAPPSFCHRDIIP